MEPFPIIIYADEMDYPYENTTLQHICREQQLVLLPIHFIRSAAIVGPIVDQASPDAWDSARRRLQLHRSELAGPRLTSAAAKHFAACLAVHMLESYSHRDSALMNSIYRINLPTLEVELHHFLPHPLTNKISRPLHWSRLDAARPASLASTADLADELHPDEPHSLQWEALFKLFEAWTSERTGILLSWSEEDLPQLPLALCRVQASDPQAGGPADSLPASIEAGITHIEARQEAGLSGLEAYLAGLAAACEGHEQLRAAGIGAGTTSCEAIGRALQKSLMERLERRCSGPIPPAALEMTIDPIEDRHCLFYLDSLTLLKEGQPPIIAQGEACEGFPVFWIQMDNGWLGAVDLNPTLALRRALLQALYVKQLGSSGPAGPSWPFAFDVQLNQAGTPHYIDIPEVSFPYTSVTIQKAVDIVNERERPVCFAELRLDAALDSLKTFAVCWEEEPS